jgi:hypothetical protein
VARGNPEPDEFTPATFEEEEAADLRSTFVRHAIRLAIIFLVLFAGVYFAFRWSGAALRFGAARAANRSVPTWIVTGVVRDAVSRAPIPWARVEDDPTGQPPFFHADADQLGRFELRTLAEAHHLRISAAGYRSTAVSAGRVWFLWTPSGKESLNIELRRE